MATTVKSRLEAMAKKLRKYSQSHVLQFIDTLDSGGKIALLEELEGLDFELLNELIGRYVLESPEIELPKEILPAPVYPRVPSDELQGKYQKARDHGERMIAEHKVACFTVAGGMGTRLGFEGPKGDYPATPVRNKSLFRVFAESIIASEHRYNCEIPWYIMTSPANHADTVQSFKDHDYFGLNPANVMHFPQGMMPCFGKDGKILMEDKGHLAMSPDGHGGSLRALYKSGALQDMAQRGIEYISYFQVDNPLVYIVDPLFIGLHAMDTAEMSSKAVIKVDPLEKVGNFTVVDGKITVIEYSDLPEEVARKRSADGKLLIESGSIAIHLISRSFVERINQRGFSLPWHRAEKRVPYIDLEGERVVPDGPNAVKLETFVFDAVPLAERSIILAIDRDDQFAPIKNATGVDSVESSHRLQMNRHVKWLEAAGIDIPRKEDGSLNVKVEISPLFALEPEDLVRKKSQLRKLKPEDIVSLG
ncbi:MAG: UDPGP type 1 family protein [Phycisphaerae bacterium]|nr:UDPGP type 1 family protein [Phycisphaerae bacterium]